MIFSPIHIAAVWAPCPACAGFDWRTCGWWGRSGGGL